MSRLWAPSGRPRRCPMRGCVLRLLLLEVVLQLCPANTTDLNEGQLRMVADSLTMPHCRKLIEALHSDNEYSLQATPTGDSEPKSISCFRLLEHWNNHRSPNSTFQLLLMRLEELGRRDVADALAKKVYAEKVMAVQETLLDNPFKASNTSAKLRQRSQLVPLKEAMEANSTVAPPEPGSTFEIVTFALAVSLIMLLAICICDRVTNRCTIKLPRYNLRQVRPGDNFSDSTMQLLPDAI